MKINKMTNAEVANELKKLVRNGETQSVRFWQLRERLPYIKLEDILKG